MFNLLPRIIIIISLTIDVFLFFRFNYFYKAFLLTSIPLNVQYFFYALNKVKSEQIKQLILQIRPIQTTYVFGVHPNEWSENQEQNNVNTEDKHDEDDEDDNYDIKLIGLPLDIFIEYQTKNIIKEETSLEYDILGSDETYNKYKEIHQIKHLTFEQIKEIRIRL